MDVAIDDPSLLKNLSDELNYRLGLTLNTLVQLTADAAVGVDSTVNSALAVGSYLTNANIRTAVQSLAAINARPLTKDGFMGGIIHPAVVKDVYNDTSNNGLSDILKRSDAGKLMGPLDNDGVVEFAGVKFKQTTTAPTATVNSQTYYNSYVFADDAIFSIFLGKSEDGSKNYNLMIQEAPKQGSVSDPARQIGGWVSYNTKYTNTLRPGSLMTMRRIQSMSSAS